MDTDFAFKCWLGLKDPRITKIQLKQRGDFLYNATSRTFTALINNIVVLSIPSHCLQKPRKRKAPKGSQYMIRFKTDDCVKELTMQHLLPADAAKLHSAMLELYGVESKNSSGKCPPSNNAKSKITSKGEPPANLQEKGQQTSLDPPITKNHPSAEQIVKSFIRYVTQHRGENACSLVDAFLLQSPIVPLQFRPLIAQQLKIIANDYEWRTTKKKALLLV